MAQHTVNYSCGHSGVVALFGPTKDRDRKIAWMERSGSCPECYSAAKRAERQAEGPGFLVRRIQGGAEITCYQESFGIKDQLKTRGYRFCDDVYAPSDTNDLLKQMMARPTKGWRLTVRGEGDALTALVKAEVSWIRENHWKWTYAGALENVFSSVIEGRRDLLPMQEGA